VLRFLTAGESHGPALVAIVDGIPAGLPLEPASIDLQLKRRMGGYGRGARMKIEADRVEILSGVRFGRTLGSPIALLVRNRDWVHWERAMALERSPGPSEARRVTRPRPGHADLAGALKYGTHDARDILERASARETAARVAVGAVCRALLKEFGVEVASHTASVGKVEASPEGREVAWGRIVACESSPLRCANRRMERRMIREIDRARSLGDSVGGSFQVAAKGVPPGLGSHRHWDLRLSGVVARALLSIPSVKGVEIGSGFANARSRGTRVHDPIYFDSRERSFRRRTNRAGGIEGGMTNGEEIRARAYVKPLSTLPRPLRSVDLVTKRPFLATVERTDATAIAAAGVVGEAMLAVCLAEAFLDKFGGDSLKETGRNHRGFLRQLRSF
jgi:chorismate synthase